MATPPEALKIICGGREWIVDMALLRSQSAYFLAVCRPDTFVEGKEGVLTLKTAVDLYEEKRAAKESKRLAAAEESESFAAEENEASESEVVETAEGESDADESDESESDSEEDERDDLVALETDEPAIIDKMIRFICYQDYGTGPLTLHAKVFATALKYAVPGLQALAVQKFETELSGVTIDNSSTTTDLAQAIRLVFTNTPDWITVLRNAVVSRLFRETTLLDSIAIDEAIHSIQGLLMAILKQSLWRTENAGEHECSSCFWRRDWMSCKSCGLRWPECYGCTQHHSSGGDRIRCPRCGKREWDIIRRKRNENGDLEEESEEGTEEDEGSEADE